MADQAGEVRVPAGAGPDGGPGGQARPRPARPGGALGHPLRVALLDLLARRGTLTSTRGRP